MRRLPVLVFTALMLAAPLARAEDAPLSADQTAALDKEFDAAVQAAKASLPVFWGRLAENPGGQAEFGLKVVFRTPRGDGEEIWLQDIKRDGQRIVGRVNYDPETLPNLHRNDIVPIHEADIVDWTFKEGRKRYGQFTTRVIAKAHPEEAARTIASLSDNPLPLDARK